VPIKVTGLTRKDQLTVLYSPKPPFFAKLNPALTDQTSVKKKLIAQSTKFVTKRIHSTQDKEPTQTISVPKKNFMPSIP
jgi:hypothetical protein